MNASAFTLREPLRGFFSLRSNQPGANFFCQCPPALLLRSAERTLRVPMARELCRSAPFDGQPAVGYLVSTRFAPLGRRGFALREVGGVFRGVDVEDAAE
jgi:hypothetical protein